MIETERLTSASNLQTLLTLLATPPLTIIGVRGYRVDYTGKHALFDIRSRDTIREQKKKAHQTPGRDDS